MKGAISRLAMATENPPPVRARRWKPPADGGSRRPQSRSYRLVLRLLAIPVLAVAGVFIYKGLHDRLVLPTCDSDRAKQTLSNILKELQLEPVRYEPLNTVSSTKDQVVCNAVLPLPDGATIAIDYSFYWQGDKANMKYSVARKAS
jgi:hypothetical protein